MSNECPMTHDQGQATPDNRKNQLDRKLKLEITRVLSKVKPELERLRLDLDKLKREPDGETNRR